MNVLIIDDDLDFSINLIQLLYLHDHSAEYCNSAELYFSNYESRILDFNLIIIDLMLPPTYDAEGIEILKDIKVRHNEIPIVMISQKDQSMTKIVNKAYKIGIDSFLDKNDSNFELDVIREIKGIEKKMNDRIFISHGHNELIKLKLKDFLTDSLKKEVIILNEMPNNGQTVVEKLESASKLCNMAIVILTKDDQTVEGGMRARQNVIHEVGFFQGKYGRRNVILLCEYGVELFSNISGVLTIEFEADNFDAIKEDIRRELSCKLDS